MCDFVGNYMIITQRFNFGTRLYLSLSTNHRPSGPSGPTPLSEHRRPFTKNSELSGKTDTNLKRQLLCLHMY